MTQRLALARSALRRFRRDDDGSMTVFTLFLILIMLILAGTAVDIMRHETARSRLQSVSDRAVLAAADLQQSYGPSWDAEDVVRDYFEKAGLLGLLQSVRVTESVNSRQVEAVASLEIDTLFMKLAGVEQLSVPAGGGARESASDIEIVMSLDVSGSMVDNGSTRLQNLKGAANEFIDVVLSADDHDRVSIALVPFNGQVNLGQSLRQRFNGITDVVTNPAGINCVDLPSSVYSTTALAANQAMAATAYSDTFSGTWRSDLTSYRHYSDNWSGGYTYGRPEEGNRWCMDLPGNVVRLPTNSITTLQGYINGLQGDGATSINAGMRWAMTMLEPNSRSIFAGMPAAQRDMDFADRPFNFNRPNTRKIVILMTDGANFAEERVNGGFRSGVSPIWRATDGKYSILHASRLSSTNSTERCRPFWVPHLGAWHVRPWTGSSTNATTGCYSATATYTNTTRQDWQAVWRELRMSWVAHQLYSRALGVPYATQMNTFRTQTPTTTMDAQLDQMCDLARQEGVTVYGVAFEAPPQGQSVIRGCASSESHYFYTTTSQIDDTFRDIANHINALRLTQ